MATQVSICNLALHRLGQAKISSLSDDNKRAQVLNDIYTDTLREALEIAPWNESLKRATLTNTGVAPAFEYAYQFTRPSDLISIVEEYEGSEFKLESTILSDSATLYIIYVYENTTPSTYSASFVNLLSLMLAYKASYSLVQDKELTEQLKAELKDAIDEAQFNNSKTTRRENVKINTFLQSRY